MNSQKPYEDPFWVVPGTIFFGFLINALSHAWLLLRGDPLVKRYRGTLQFKSAWIGDGVLLPVINVAAGRLVTLGNPVTAGTSLVAGAALSTIVTGAMHGLQAKQGLVNWSMPEPWRWNALGYYHLVFMWLQLGWVGFALVQAVRNIRDVGAAGLGLLAVIGSALVAFAAVLKLDYPESGSQTAAR